MPVDFGADPHRDGGHGIHVRPRRVKVHDTRPEHVTAVNNGVGNKRLATALHPIEQLAIQITGDIAMDYYRINATWANSTGGEVRTDRFRITHTWTRTHGTWQIIGGMSSPVNADGQ